MTNDTARRPLSLPANLAALAPGLAVTILAALLAWTVARFTPAPAMVLALALGMALNPIIGRNSMFAAGIAFSARTVLRVGVVLLGARVTLGDLASLGLPTVLLAVGGVIVTVAGGAFIGRALGLKADHAVLSAGAVAICGASAALAISAVLPRRPESDRNTMLAIVGVTALSTLAMVTYPAITQALNMDERTAGVFLGASIHDVAQVVGAGFMISENAAETATIVKLMRVACLAPVVIAIGFVFRGSTAAENSTARAWPVPAFLLGFFALMLIASTGLVSPVVTSALTNASQWCLLTAVAALGAKTSIKDLIAPGAAPLLALCLQTLLIGAFALGGVLLLAG